MADDEGVRICKEMMACKDYYAILGVSKTATLEEIKKAYKKKSLKVHPDKNKCPEAQEAFKRLSQAYVSLSDDDKRRQYDSCGTEEEFMRRQQGQGQNPFQNFDPEDIFREMFAGGGLPPEFAHIFAHSMGGNMRGGRRRGGGDLFDMFGGGFPGGGGGATFSFSSMGPGGSRVHYSSGGQQQQRRRNDGQEPRNLEDEMRRRQENARPPTFIEVIIHYIKQIMYCCFISQIFLGIGPGYFIGIITYLLSSESNIERWDFRMNATNYHRHEMKTTNFDASYFLQEKHYDTLNVMKMQRPEKFKEFNNNMEKHMYKQAKIECSEAKFEQQRLRQRARYFNHRPEKAQEILNQAENLPELMRCELQEHFENVMEHQSKLGQ